MVSLKGQVVCEAFFWGLCQDGMKVSINQLVTCLRGWIIISVY